MQWQSLVIVVDLCLTNHTNLLLFHFQKGNFGKKWFVGEAFKFHGLVNGLGYIMLKIKMLCCAILLLVFIRKKKLQWSPNLDMAFISKGYHNWKDVSTKFNIHSSSNCHKEVTLKVTTLPSTTKDVRESLSAIHQQEKLERHQCFFKSFSNIRFLARQGLPLRGLGDESDSNFIQLLKLRSEDDIRFVNWIEKKTDKYLAPDIQNKVLKVMSLQVLRQIVQSLSTVLFLTIMVDETTDISNKDKVVVCF